MFVYVIKSSPGPVKIGKAVDPSSRLKILQTGAPFRLSLEKVCRCDDEKSAYKVEKSAQRVLRGKRLTGEWFDVSVDDAIAAIEEAVDKQKTELQRAALSEGGVRSICDTISSNSILSDSSENGQPPGSAVSVEEKAVVSDDDVIVVIDDHQEDDEVVVVIRCEDDPLEDEVVLVYVDESDDLSGSATEIAA
jgi:hypothetical protein